VDAQAWRLGADAVVRSGAVLCVCVCVYVCVCVSMREKDTHRKGEREIGDVTGPMRPSRMVGVTWWRG
jgi:hypothetical protein